MTIIAADGEVHDGPCRPSSASATGLLGLRGISGPRNLRQRLVPLGDEKVVVRKSHVYVFRGGANWFPYYQRAWTYQERLLSPLKVYFHERQLHWECSCHVRHEEQVHPDKIDEMDDFRYRDMSAMLAGFPELAALDRVCSSYNYRALRYDEDALPAVSGLLSVLSRAFPGGFLCGIPEMFFERGLGWRPMASYKDIRRRIRSEKPDRDGQSSPSSSTLAVLPSWSWIGWQGEITIEEIGGPSEATRIDGRASAVEETMPITRWYTGYTSAIADMSQRREIKSTWYEQRDMYYKNFSRPLLPGWTRHAAPKTDLFGRARVCPDGCSEYIFRHEAMPKPQTDLEPGADWYYPFPVPAVVPSGPPGIMPEQTPYLFCETARAWLWGYQEGIRMQNEVKLHNSSGDEVGKLHLPNRSSLEAFPKGPFVATDDGDDERKEKRGITSRECTKCL